MTLADARPELVWNQLTGGSNSIHSLFTPVRVAAAIASGRLLDAAARSGASSEPNLSIVDGTVTGPGGQRATFGELTHHAAGVDARRRSASRSRRRRSSRSSALPSHGSTGATSSPAARQFAMDLDVPGALPTMLCRAPTINASALSVRNLAAVQAMSGVTDVAIIPHTDNVPGGVAVRAATFGQCIDAVRALDVEWGPGTVDGKSDADVLAELTAAELPMTPALPLIKTLDERFTFHFRPGDPLETNCAVADVTSDRAEVWSCFKTPIWFQEQLALILGLLPTSVTVHVVQGGGSFGRHLYADAALRGRGRVEGDGQAGEADVAPHRQLPPGPGAPDGDLAGADHLPRRERPHVRPAAHERRDRLHARLRRAAHRDGRDAARPGTSATPRRSSR